MDCYSQLVELVMVQTLKNESVLKLSSQNLLNSLR